MASLAQHLRIIAGKIETGEDCREDVVTLLRAADLMARFMAVADEVRTIEQLVSRPSRFVLNQAGRDGQKAYRQSRRPLRKQ